MKKRNYDLVNELIDMKIKHINYKTAKIVFFSMCIDLADKVIGFIIKYYDLINMVYNYLLKRYGRLPRKMASQI